MFIDPSSERRTTIAVALAVALSGAASPARAEGPGRVVAVDVTSGEGCPAPPEILADLATRLPPDMVVGSSASARRVSIRLARDEAGYSGDLVWGDEPARTFRADACDTVVRAILLSASLSSNAPEPPPPPVPATTEANAAASKPAPPPSSQRVASAATTPSETSRPRFTYGAVGRFFGAAGSPNVAVGGAAEVGLDRPGVLSPAVRFTLTRSFASYPDAMPSARIVSTVAALDVCPIRFGNDVVYATPCLGLEAGSLSFTARAAHDDAFWIAPTVTARAGVTVAEPLGLELATGIDVPLVPVHFVHEDEPGFVEEAYASAPIGFVLQTGIVVTFR